MRGARNNSTATNTVNVPIQSKSFENFIKARERITKLAKEHAEKLNKGALDRVKHQKLAEKAAKEMDEYKKERLEKVHEA